MKVIAITDFYNNVGLEVEGQPHPNHIHKGAIFEIGGKDVPFSKLKKAEQELVISLNAANRLGDPSDEKTVKAVQAELAAEKKAEASRAKPAAPAK